MRRPSGSCSWRQRRVHRRAARGQASVFVVLMLGLFLLGLIGFAVDMTNLWMHRQRAQTAADAACTAGAMDLLLDAENAATGKAGFTPGTPFDCAATPGAAPCLYAAANGYGSAGLLTGQPSDDVSISFPGTIPGVTPPPASMAAAPFMRVDVVDRVPVFFAAMLLPSRTEDVRAMAKCGVVTANAPNPILILHPSDPGSLTVQGTPNVAIQGGPNKSIQVNSSNTAAVTIGGSATIDLSHGGTLFSGSDLGVFGGPATAPGGFLPGATGQWQSPAAPVGDPYSLLNAPAVPAPGVVSSVAYGVNGCPDAGGCKEYTGGAYPGGIQVKNGTAIFDPGLYSITGGLSLAANSLVRPSTAAGDGSGGTTFYFSGASSVSVAANSGTRTVDAFNTTRVICPGAPAPNPPLPATLQGNILMGPCTGYYGDPMGQYRGMLFFQDRSQAANANWGGGGQFLLAGSMYFHQCNAAGTGTACGAPPADYNTIFTLQGNSGSGTYVLGNITADLLRLGGTSGIEMELDPSAVSIVLKASLLR